jgi:hypothetical protein
VGRCYRDAPDIDGNVLVKMSPRERRANPPGTLLRVRISGAGAYDLSGKPAADAAATEHVVADSAEPANSR